MYLCANNINKSISDTAIKSGFSASWSICQHGCLTEVNTTFHRYNKAMKKHVGLNWDAIINLLDEQFILPIPTLSAPHNSTLLCPVVDKPSNSICSISRKLRIHCERCMFTQTIEIKGEFDFKAASQAKVSNYKKQKGQTCQKVLLRTENMMKIRMTEMTLQ